MAQVRFARMSDLSDCLSFDHAASQAVIRGKIKMKEVLVATNGVQNVGYLRLEYLWSRIPYIGLIMVKDGMRGKGVGREMLRFLQTCLKRNGYQLLLSSSQANEPRPQHWHRKMGFEECGVIAGINEGNVGEVFFRKSLRS